MTTTASLADPSRAGARGEDEVLALVIAWSAEEPLRVGEIALLLERETSFLGRADEDGARDRLRFVRQRPGQASRPASIEGRAISRKQLVFTPVADGSFEVERVGRCPLYVNGKPEDHATISAGDTLLLERQLLVYVTRRPRTLIGLRHFPDEGWGEFGEPDALGILGESAAAWRLRDRLAFAAKADAHVLLVGESGTGKELAARAIHELSRRSKKPLVSRNAATLPAGLIDAELFGNVKNYPNPGMPERPGLIGQASGGTLFLDEIGELPTDMQAHLLRVLDADGEYQRLGEASVRRSDLRLVGATNRDPRALKHDLLARLTVRVELPPISERREDVPLLLRHLLMRAARRVPDLAERFVSKKHGVPLPRVEAELVDHLLRRRLPLNVREVDALLWRAMESAPARGGGETLALTDEVLADADSGPGPVSEAETSMAATSATVSVSAIALEPTAEDIQATLVREGGSITRTARSLGLSSRYALYRLMKKYGIAIPER
jgi:DNA-binding NtrC family response regulator